MSSQGPQLNHLYEALGSAFGVVVQCSHTEKARQAYYKLRKEAQDPDLESLSIVQSPTDPQQLWIVKVPKP